MNIQLKTIFGDIIIEGDFSCIADAVKAAIAGKKSLSSANLRSANLRSANLSSADLSSADLSYANLRSANLRSANLSSADLSSADLSSADLSYANLSYADLRYAIHRYAQIAFTEHGECGRMLTAVQLKKDGPISFFCGCFNGTEKQLRDYIDNGDKRLVKTRSLAMKTALELLKAENDKE